MKLKKIIVFVLLVSLVLSIPLQVKAEASTLDMEYVYEIMNFLEENYVEEIPQEMYVEGALKGLFYYLDRYSEYYTKEEFTSLLEDLTGNVAGIGVYINEENGFIKIEETMKDGPANKAGLMPGDSIIYVNGKSVKGKSTEEVSKLIRGKVGTVVRVGVRRGNNPLKVYFIKREEIKINPVTYKELENKIGYISLSQFNEYAYENMKKALNYMDNKKINDIILDLRDNPGGYLDQAIEISRLFVPKGPIVHMKYRNEDIKTYYSTLKQNKYNLVLLVNENSASASVIVTAAIKDSKAGQIVGVTTYGKGTVQQILALPKGDGLKLTIAEYLSPNKTIINHIGIKPNIVVKDKNEQLKEAIKLFKSK